MTKSTTKSKSSKPKPKPLSMAQVKAFLRMAGFNPRADGPMKAIVEMKEPVYYECRMKELLTQAKTQREDGQEGDYVETQLMIIKLATLAAINN